MNQAEDSLRIRPIAGSDVAAFRELRLEALRLHPAAFTSDHAVHERHPIEFWNERVRSFTGNPRQTLFLAEDDTGLVGMMGIRAGDSPKTEHSATIWGAYVRPAFRGRRAGSRLVEACLEWARRSGIRIVKLGVVATNAEAIRCYERCGFTTYGTERLALSWNGQDHDELLMSVTL